MLWVKDRKFCTKTTGVLKRDLKKREPHVTPPKNYPQEPERASRHTKGGGQPMPWLQKLLGLESPLEVGRESFTPKILRPSRFQLFLEFEFLNLFRNIREIWTLEFLCAL